MKYLVLAAALLSGCSTQALVDTVYPDREKFAFRSKDSGSILTYTCEPSSTEAKTKQRARAAHSYFDARFTKAVEGTVDVIAESEGTVSVRGLSRALDKEMEDIVLQTEDRFQCLFSDYRDA